MTSAISPLKALLKLAFTDAPACNAPDQRHNIGIAQFVRHLTGNNAQRQLQSSALLPASSPPLPGYFTAAAGYRSSDQFRYRGTAPDQPPLPTSVGRRPGIAGQQVSPVSAMALAACPSAFRITDSADSFVHPAKILRPEQVAS